MQRIGGALANGRRFGSRVAGAGPATKKREGRRKWRVIGGSRGRHRFRNRSGKGRETDIGHPGARPSRNRASGDSERGDRSKPAAPFIPPVWYRARPWDPPITNDAAYL
ncbi:hypothetical protein Asi03nite_46860 [Actinoplanes siamensis]|uniref:Uncharacterized protein n=1 Tax=Actinoplanes siamensis TaxID=1223317 RepID=A0A919TMD2_9ACTN|nr:hypothetical protein Asi03nite_46860 [Actinoplanes siamensis]